MNELTKYVPVIVIFLLISFVFFFKLTSSFNFHPDFARDAYDILTIVQGKLTLIGPKLSFGGIYSGPYYYYLFVPPFYLSNLNLNSLLIFNSFFFIGALLFFYINAKKKFGATNALIGASTIAFLPIYLLYSRSPWNGATYIPFLLVFLTLLYFDTFENKKIKLFFLGLLGGAIITVHLVSLSVVIVAIPYLFYFMKKKRNIFYFLLGCALAFTPLVLFELKHDFIMYKNTFITKSYATFIGNKNILGVSSGKKNIIENVLFIFNQLSSQLGANLLIYFAIFVAFWKKSKRKEQFFITSSMVLFLFLTFSLRFQFGAHYLFPVSLFVVFTGVIALLDARHMWLLLVLLFFEILSFPRGIYQDSTRKAQKYEKAVNYVIDNKLIRKDERFNVVQVSQDFGVYVPTGHEYRFFLKKNNFTPLSEFEYDISDALFIFSDDPSFDIANLNNWEVQQFGKNYLKNAKRFRENATTIYIVRK